MKRRWAYLILGGTWLGAFPANGTASVSPVVVELYESQGCSSCPPAEKVMKELEHEFGPSVILLTYHVDYWDHLGWKDTFSDARYTQRQSDYAQSFGNSSIYTPEMVIQGEVGFVGSDFRRARAEIQKRLNQPRLALSLKYEGSPGRPREGNVHILLPPDLNHQARRVTVVIFENAAPVHVQRGENAGRTMRGDFAVRKFWAIPPADSGRYDLPLRLESDWNPRQTGVAVLVQGDSPQILASETQSLAVN